MRERKVVAGAFIDDDLAFLLAKASHRISVGFHARPKCIGVAIPMWRILALLKDRCCTVGELTGRGRDAGNRRSVHGKLLPLANAHEAEVFAGRPAGQRRQLVEIPRIAMERATSLRASAVRESRNAG